MVRQTHTSISDQGASDQRIRAFSLSEFAFQGLFGLNRIRIGVVRCEEYKMTV